MLVNAKNDYKTKSYITKSTKKHNDLEGYTSVENVCKSNLYSIVSRLSRQLKHGTFEDSTVSTIEKIRHVSDLRKFALELKRHGAIQTGHKFST